MVFVVSTMETALLNFAKELGWPSFRKTRDGANITQMMPFTIETKTIGVVMQW
jgi:P-type Ca2+ transporter type 2C